MRMTPPGRATSSRFGSDEDRRRRRVSECLRPSERADDSDERVRPSMAAGLAPRMKSKVERGHHSEDRSGIMTRRHGFRVVMILAAAIALPLGGLVIWKAASSPSSHQAVAVAAPPRA